MARQLRATDSDVFYGGNWKGGSELENVKF